MTLQVAERAALHDAVGRFLRDHVEPSIDAWEEEARFPLEILPLLGELGLLGPVPGGESMDTTARLDLYRQLGAAYRPLNFVVSHAVVAQLIATAGEAHLRDRWSEALAAGAVLAVAAIGEPTEDSGGASKASWDGERWKLDAIKTFVPAAAVADVCLVTAEVESGDGSETGLFVVDMDDGVTVSDLGESLAYAPLGLYELRISGVVPSSARLIHDGAGGFLVQRTRIQHAMGIAAFAAGSTKACLERATAYAREREQFGRPIGSFQAIQMKIADIAADLELAEASVELADSREDLSAAATAKVMATDASERAAERALELHGGYGYLREYQVERLLREAKSDQVLWGNNERLRDLITTTGWDGRDTESSQEGGLVDRTRVFLEQEVRPRIPQMEAGDYPVELIRGLGELGVMGLSTKFGRDGSVPRRERVQVYEAMGRVYKPLSSILIHNMVVELVDRFGTPEQHAEWLPSLTSGAAWTAFGMTEPEAGSDAASMRSRAERVDDGYLLNGEKVFISQADRADATLIAAKTQPDAGASGISVFLVPRDTPGFSVPHLEPKMGYWAHHTCHVVLEDCFVPTENRLGAEGAGLRMLLAVLAGCRIDVAALGVGAAQGVYEIVRDHIAGRPGSVSTERVRTGLGDMASKIGTARQVVRRAAAQDDLGEDVRREAATAKVIATDMNVDICRTAVQLMGGDGCLREHLVERYFRESKLDQIGLGTNEIQRLIIAKELLGDDT